MPNGTRYWILRPDGKGADGPYEAHELRSLSDFGPDRVVAPENAQTVDAWKPAGTVSDLRILFVRPPTMSAPAIGTNQPRQASPQPKSPVVPTVPAATRPTRGGIDLPWSDVFKVLAVVGVIAGLPVVGWWWSKNKPKGQTPKPTPPPATKSAIPSRSAPGPKMPKTQIRSRRREPATATMTGRAPTRQTQDAVAETDAYRAALGDISYFGWRKGDKATFKIGVARGHSSSLRKIHQREGAYLVLRTDSVRRSPNRVVASVLATMWSNYGLGTPDNKVRRTYVADSEGVYVDAKMLEGEGRGSEKRAYIARFPLKENVADQKYGTVLRKFGTPPELPANVPVSDCVLIKLPNNEYHTYCKGVGLVSASDDLPDVDAGVPGSDSTYVLLLEKFEAGAEEVASRNRIARRDIVLPKSLRGKILTNITMSKLADDPRRFKNKLILVDGEVKQLLDGQKRKARFGIAKPGNIHEGLSGALDPNADFEEEESLRITTFVFMTDADDGKFMFGFGDGMEPPQVGVRAAVVGRYLGNVFGTEGPSGAPEVTPGVFLEAVKVIDSVSPRGSERKGSPRPDSPSGNKDVMQMSADELDRYLKRGKGGQ